jgi:hypothetical protein
MTLSNAQDELSLTVFEAITLETRLILPSMEMAGIRIDQIRETEGGASSKF